MEPTPDQGPALSTPGDEGPEDLVVEPLCYSEPATVTRLLDTQVSSKTLEEVIQEAKQKSSSIFANYDTLNAILLRHESVIQSRWAKKKTSQRAAILDKAWPGMVEVHRPDLIAFYNKRKPAGSAQVKVHVDSYKWPHINQEDLTKPRPLLLLLNARGRREPTEFAAADFEAMHLGLATRQIMPIFLNEHVMILHKVPDREKYGTLLPWNEHKDTFEWMRTRTQFLPGEGLLILEAQERLMEFLVKVCKLILHDISAEALVGGDSVIRPEPRLKKNAEIDGFESLTAMTAERPYRLPAEINFDQMEAVLGAAESAAEDHFGSMRVDPGYFAMNIRDAKEHRKEILKDTMGQTHPTLKGARQDVFISRLVGFIITSAIEQLEIFTWLRMQAQTLRSLHKKYESTLSSDEDLPDDFLSAILRFRHYLGQASKGLGGLLQTAFPSSPNARKYFVQMPPSNGSTSKDQVILKPDARMSIVEGDVTFLLQTIWSKDMYQELSVVGLPTVMDELDRLIQSNAEAKQFISPTVSGLLGDLSIICQCRDQIDHFLPWARGFEHKHLEQQRGIMAEFTKTVGPLQAVGKSLDEKKIMHAAKLCDPSEKKLSYPTSGRRTKETTETMRRAEETLEHFWAQIDKLIQKECSELDRLTFWKMLSQPRPIQRTPEWVDPKSTRAKASRVNNIDATDMVYRPLSNIFLGHQDQGQYKHARGKAKTKHKVKTKGQPTEQQASHDTDTQDAAPPVVDLPSIPVDARSLKVFRTMFYNPAVTSTPGVMIWKDFLHAMTSTGLFSVEKRGGSAWQFHRVDDDLKRMQFHEPHPDPKLPFETARHWGRLLYRAYGWEGKMFVLKEKKGNKPSEALVAAEAS
ncbi:unnamed protein product [Clonostachys chloroleuca]|uniref:Uncharacterized protein n=1 Tax=Clonostachys chloroleuca TaxID=1926264 RepID=A0AA35PXX8_9HYPO|nr:unnamed protein product [Clonostachys chloroleuca]